MITLNWQLLETCPREIKVAWLYCPVDGVYIGQKGMAGEWWNGSQRAWSPTHWAPYEPPEIPEPPKESQNVHPN